MPLSNATLAQLAKLNSAVGPVAADAKPIGNAAAVGTITTIAVASLIDGETFFLDDGINPEVTFEFDVAGNGVAGANTAVDVSTDTTADDVRDRIVAVITALPSSTLALSAAGPVAATVDLTNELAGVVGNLTPTIDTVANAGFIVSAMASGVDYPTVFPVLDGDGIDTAEVTRSVVSIKPTGGDVVFDIVGRTEGTSDKFEGLNNLIGLTATDGIGWKEIINCAPETELAIYIVSGTATLENVATTIAPCTG